MTFTFVYGVREVFLGAVFLLALLWIAASAVVQAWRSFRGKR